MGELGHHPMAMVATTMMLAALSRKNQLAPARLSRIGRLCSSAVHVAPQITGSAAATMTRREIKRKISIGVEPTAWSAVSANHCTLLMAELVGLSWRDHADL